MPASRVRAQARENFSVHVSETNDAPMIRGANTTVSLTAVVTATTVRSMGQLLGTGILRVGGLRLQAAIGLADLGQRFLGGRADGSQVPHLAPGSRRALAVEVEA